MDISWRRGSAGSIRFVACEQLEGLVPDDVNAGPEVPEDPRCHRVLVTEQAEEEVLGSDVVVAQLQGLFHRPPEYRLRPRGEGSFPLPKESIA